MNTTPAGTAPCSTGSSDQLNLTQPVPPVHAAVNVETVNRIDAFTNFIQEWMDTNVKVFTRKENDNDSEVL